ncbi:MAG: MmgE/PrpD family protein [Deltaproteobacteria bacterium]|nr:MmgE/PrpD family protein [Deltaproteobacteria bacterium]MBI3078487.1 MmgE/PrpD family protein [Deltaproteobacteria bacterium]
MSTVSEALAAFTAGLRWRDVPSPVREQVARLTLDTLGIALAASTMEFGRAVTRTVTVMGGTPESTVIGSPVRVPAAQAVLANGTLAHGLDFDDTLEDAIVHTGCVAVTTALAVGEAVGARGGQVLEAALAGVEVMARLGLAAPGQFHARGFHPTALCAPLGGATVAGKLYGLTEAQLVHAYGLAGSQAGGIIEYLADGSWTKRLHPGWGAHAGVLAALLAREGFTGPRTVFEGRQGFFRAFGGLEGAARARLDEGLGTLGATWSVTHLMFKSYPCGSIAHPYMDCASRLRGEHRLDPEEIVEVRCRTAPGPVPRLWEPLGEKQSPGTGYGAKFSLPYLLAVMLSRGRTTLAEFTDEAVQDPSVRALARRISYELDPTIDYPKHFLGHVRVTLRDGQVLEAWQEHPRGGPDHPLPLEELTAKFYQNAGLAVPGVEAEALGEAILSLETLPAVSSLAARLASGPA